MANVLTDLAADIYKAADMVGREVVGGITSVTINSGSEAAAKGDTVRSHSTRKPTLNTSITPSMTIPEGDDQTVDNKTLTLNQVANVKIPWTGEDIKHVNNGSGFETIYGDQIKQAMRAIVNQIETHVCTVAYQGASRAVGTAGTPPFASNHNLINSARQILVDNGMSTNDGMLSLVMSTSAGTNIRNLTNLHKVNEGGSDVLLRQGVLQDISGIMLKESAQVVSHTKGTGTGYLLNDASSAIDDTTITVDTGTGTVVAGDVIDFAADTTNDYVVNTALSGGSFTIGDPGLRAAIADNNAMTVGNDYTANFLLHQGAIELAIRPFAEPEGGDAAVDRLTVQDPHSGLVFVISVYKGYKKAMFDITTLYQAKSWNSDAIAVVMG